MEITISCEEPRFNLPTLCKVSGYANGAIQVNKDGSITDMNFEERDVNVFLEGYFTEKSREIGDVAYLLITRRVL